jgi:hypothetical protein
MSKPKQQPAATGKPGPKVAHSKRASQRSKAEPSVFRVLPAKLHNRV